MSLRAFPKLTEKLQNRKYRTAHVSAATRHFVALQIKTLRGIKKWSQSDLGNAAGKPQNVISRLEDPSYGKVTVQTLLDLAAAFDVALILRFASFGEMADSMRDLSGDALRVPSFDEELAGLEAEQKKTSHHDIRSTRSSSHWASEQQAQGAAAFAQRESARGLGSIHGGSRSRASAVAGIEP